MNENFRCGDHEALVAYLYEESEPSEREAVAAHVARCASCAEEIESLQSTRAMLGAWTPPEVSLGFQITRADERVESKVLRPAAWWRRPLPAWAQAAAALLIFAAGMTLGSTRTVAVVQPAATPVPVPATVASRAPQTPAVATVSREDLARLEQRLRAVETARNQGLSAARVQAASIQSPASTVDDATRGQIEARLAATEQNILLIGNALRRLDLQQRGDMQQVAERVGVIHDTTQRELARQTNAIVRLTSLTTSGGAR